MLLLIQRPLLWIPLLLGSVSISTLLLYFNGWLDMGQGVRWLLVPAVILFLLVAYWAKRTGRTDVSDRMLAGLWAGAMATLAYDLVRVPIAWAGVPVFKAVSYFGTVIMDQAAPTVTSEVVGWLYHLSNGIGFGIMYAVMVRRPRWWTAVAWGVLLELMMLLTPYAEVFGYKISSQFLAMTIGAHIVYGLALWAALRYWLGSRPWGEGVSRPQVRLIALAVLVPLGIGAVAADFHRRHGRAIPPSPPRYVGPHLYTTWSVLDPDRLAAMWTLQRFRDPKARFHFVTPFSPITYGTAFDTPEAAIRRSGTVAATEVLVAQLGLWDDLRLQQLARVAHLYEIALWMLPAHPAEQRFGQQLLEATGRCAAPEMMPCLERGFAHLDAWYATR